MARPFSPQRHFDLVDRVVNKFARLAKHVDGQAQADYLKLSKAAGNVKSYIKAGQFGQGVAYMNKIGEALIVELPTTFETLKNQNELRKAKTKAKKKAA